MPPLGRFVPLFCFRGSLAKSRHRHRTGKQKTKNAEAALCFGVDPSFLLFFSVFQNKARKDTQHMTKIYTYYYTHYIYCHFKRRFTPLVFSIL